MVNQDAVGIDPGFPTAHSGRDGCNQIHAAVLARLVPSDSLKALAPEQLTLAGDILDI